MRPGQGLSPHSPLSPATSRTPPHRSSSATNTPHHTGAAIPPFNQPLQPQLTSCPGSTPTNWPSLSHAAHELQSPLVPARRSLSSFGFQFTIDGHSRCSRLSHSQHAAPKKHCSSSSSSSEYLAYGGSSPLLQANAGCLSTPLPLQPCSLSASHSGTSQQQQRCEHYVHDLVPSHPTSRRSVDVPAHKNGEMLRLGRRTSAVLRSQ